MKKFIAFALTLIMSFSVLTGCSSDPVAEELEKFINTDMKDVNAKQKELSAELEKWSTYEDEVAMTTSINDIILPTIEEALDSISKIELSTKEVKALKDTYENGLTTYKDAYELMLSAIETGDEATYTESSEMLVEANDLFKEYNDAAEKLAKEKDMEFESK